MGFSNITEYRARIFHVISLAGKFVIRVSYDPWYFTDNTFRGGVGAYLYLHRNKNYTL
ncbi:hypothetical protein SAMN05421858_4655 [Haladaptatus litoreus]|uniref:Uncharacterized protein n=1 Tax=Haladaptatus litoreus TaxID=553468 RepID=A0A1N7EZ80_9EURY|nr:hypothetical protein SAMN05421858_4655 [Haladaptatus litoreus]